MPPIPMTLARITLCLTLAAATATAADKTWDKEFPVDDEATLSIDNHKGKITIRTHSEPVIRAKATIYADGDDNPEYVDLVKILDRASSSRVTLGSEFERPKNNRIFMSDGGNMPFVDWEIYVPDDAALRLESHKSVLDLEVPSGRIQIETHKGNGTIQNVRSDLRLETHKGQFEIGIAELHDLRIETHKGELDITVQSASDFRISGSSHKGRLRFNGRDIRIEREDGESFVDYQDGSGKHDIDISTHKGEIVFDFVN